jgi:hypothetical protein
MLRDGDLVSAVLWLLFVGFICGQFPNHMLSQSTYDKLYKSAVQAYNQERWYECASLMNMALEERKTYLRGAVQCRKQCRLSVPIDEIMSKTIEDSMAYLELGSSYSECVGACKQSEFKKLVDIVEDQDIEDAFKQLLPYDYLQMCAFKVAK